MGNMDIKKYIVVAALLTTLSVGLNVANAGNSNSLLQMDVKRSSIANTVDVTFYTTGDSTNSVVTRKSNNRYVVLLPNIDSTSSVTPGIGGVKDMISDVEVKHVNDGIGGYTKITFTTTKPINIKTYMRKTAPLTQAQKDYKAIIAQNNIKQVSTTKPVNSQNHTTQSQPAVAKQVTTHNTKPAVTTSNTAAKTSAPKTTQNQVKPTQNQILPTKNASTPKITLIEVPKPKVQAQKSNDTIKPKVQQQKPQVEPKKVVEKQPTTNNLLATNGYVPKMKFDANGKRMVDLEPRVSHEIKPEPKTQAPAQDPMFNVEQTQPLDTQMDNQALNDEGISTSEAPTAVETPEDTNNSKPSFPVWIFLAGGAVLAVAVIYLIFDAMSHANEKDQERLKSFFSLSSKNQAKRRRREYYDIVNNEDLSWQEKYKLYTEKEESQKPKKSSMAMSYVTDMSGVKKAIINPVENEEKVSTQTNMTSSLQQTSRKAPELSLDTIKDSIQNIPDSHKEKLQEKLQAKISQMEHSLAQTPNIEEPEEQIQGVRSEDDAIMKNLSSVKLKSFSKPLTLKETNRSLIEEDKKLSRNKSYKEGRFVKLKNSPLSVSRRKSASSELEASDLIGTGSKYLTNNGEMKMNKENENYLLSSLDEYLSILDNEEKSSTTTVSKADVAESLSKMRSSSIAMSRSGVSNPIAKASNPMTKQNNAPTPYMNGLIVKSGYNIDSEKGFYLVNIDGVSALVGRIKDSIFILKKFDYVVDKPLQVRPDDANVYIVRVGKFKCLVDVSKDKMGTLIEI